MTLPEQAFKTSPDGKSVLVKLHIQPRSSKEAVSGDWNGEAVKINLNAPPVDGKANAALIKFLAGILKTPRGMISIVRGESSHNKTVCIQNMSADAIKNILERA